MNDDLKQFSEERLKNIIELADNPTMAALARIALAAKQAKPVGYIAEVSGNRIGVLRGLPIPEIGSFIYTTPQPTHTEQAIPDGWRLVPIEATREMIWAGKENLSIVGWESFQRAYQAMLAAAPKPESE